MLSGSEAKQLVKRLDLMDENIRSNVASIGSTAELEGDSITGQ